MKQTQKPQQCIPSKRRGRSVSRSSAFARLPLMLSIVLVAAGLSVMPSSTSVAEDAPGESALLAVPSVTQMLKNSPFKDSQLLPPQVPDDQAQRQADESPLSSKAETAAVQRLPAIDQWTPTSHTRYVRGEARTNYFSQPTFRRTSNGWKRLSGRLTRVKRQKVRANQALLPADFATSGSRVMTLALPKGRISFLLNHAKLSQPQISGRRGRATLRYTDVFPGVDLTYEVHGAKIKEAFVIKNRKSRRSFTFEVNDAQHLLGTATPTAAGGYSFSSEVADDTTMSLAAPVAWSARQSRKGAGSVSGNASQTATQDVTRTASGYRIRLALSDAWSKDQKYPIVLDPTITYSYAAGTLVSGSAPGSSTACSGSPCPLRSNTDGSTAVAGSKSDLSVAYYKMDLSNIPSGTDIDTARFTLGWNYGNSYAPEHVATELHAINRALPPNPTGASVLASEETTAVPGAETRVGATGRDYLTTFDVTSIVKNWTANNLGSKAGLAQQSSQTSSTFPYYDNSANCPLSTYTSADFCYYVPKLAVDYQGAALPPPIPVEQTWGCNCSFYHGPDSVRDVGDPVSTATGHMMEHFVDLTTPSAGMPMTLSRTYNGQDTSDRALGVGWTHEYDSSLSVQTGTGDVTFRDPTGGRMVFRAKTGGTYLGDSGVTATLTSVSGGGWTLRSTSGEVITFGPAGRELSDKDAAGYGVTLTYEGLSASRQLTKITDAAGNVTTLTYGAGALSGKVIKALANDGRSVLYGYTTVANATRLTSTTDPLGKITTYTYDTVTGQLIGIKDPLNQLSAQNVFDATTGRIVKQTDAAGNILTFTWAPSTATSAPTGTGTQTTKDNNGDVVSVDTYYGNVITSHADGEGDTTRYYYDAALNNTAVTTPRGDVTTMTYDLRGNMLTKKTGSLSTETWVYDNSDNVTSYTDMAGATTTYVFDATNRLQSSTNPLGGVTRYTYNPQGLVLTEVSPAGRTTTNTYDADGNVLTQTSPAGNKTSYTYDQAGHLLSETDPRGNITGATPATYTTTYTYDSAGQLLTSTDPRGTVTTNTYDSAGRALTTQVRDTSSNLSQDTTRTFDPNGRLLSTKDFARATITNVYDMRGRLSSATDADGGMTTYTYDKADRLVAEVTPRGHANNANPLSFTWYYTYDANGNLIATTDASGRVARTEYDALNRTVARISPLGRRTSVAYQVGSAKSSTRVTDPLGNASNAYYDALGQLTSSNAPGQGQTTYGYDPDGLKTTATSPSGISLTKWTYDADGNVKTIVDPRGNQNGATATQYTITSTYDAAGNQTSVTNQLGKATNWTFNALNQPLTVTDPRNQTIRYTYNSAGRLSRVTVPDDSTFASGAGPAPQTSETSFEYDNYGNVTHRIDPLYRNTYYTYNAKDQVTSSVDPLGRTNRYVYDYEGNLEAVYNGRANESGANPNNHRVSIANDQSGRRLGVVTPYAESTSYYSYNDDGNLAQASDDVMGQSTLSYDADGRLTQLHQSSGDFDYTYDPAGHVVSRSYPSGSTLTYRYNADGLQDQVTENDGVNSPAVTGFQYNAAQALTTIAYPPSTSMTQTRAYDLAGRISSIKTKKATAFAPLSRYDYQRDGNGNPTLITRTRGTVAYNEALTYNDGNALKSWCPGVTSCTNATARVDYGYDANGNLLSEDRQGAVTNPGSIRNSYDNAGQFTTQTTTVGGTTTTTGTYSYDADGNLTTGGRTWNDLDQLTSVKLSPATPTTAYTYDAFDNRRNATTGTSTQQTLWDINNPMPMPAVTVDPNNATTTQVYAPDGTLIESRHPSKAYAADYYASDDRGSVVDAFKPDGTATWANSYDPWGETLTHDKLTTDAVDSRFGYTGAYLDANTGDLALRARDYNPTVGRFTSTDPAPGATTDPYRTPYAYANNRPTLLTDPTGRCPMCIGVAALGAIGGVVGAVGYAVTTDDFSVGGLAAATGAGVVAGGAAGLTLGLSTAALGGGAIATGVGWAAAGAVGTVVGSLVTAQGLPSPFEIGIGAATGVVGGTVGIYVGRATAALIPKLAPGVSRVIQRLCGRTGANSSASAANAGSRSLPELVQAADATIPAGFTRSTWGELVWGAGGKEGAAAANARALIGRSADELAQVPGLNLRSATAWRDFYRQAVVEGKGIANPVNATNQARVDLLDDIISRLGG